MAPRIFAPESGLTYDVTDTMIVFTCANCGIPYGVPEAYIARRREDGRAYYCPNGHSLSYHETDADRLRKKLNRAEDQRASETARADRERARAEDNERRRVAQKGATTRARKRHASGVCPACKRTFQNVQRHMDSQHPDYDPTVGHHEGS